MSDSFLIKILCCAEQRSGRLARGLNPRTTENAHRLQELLFKELFPIVNQSDDRVKYETQIRGIRRSRAETLAAGIDCRPSPSFLSALAEAVLTVNPEDYAVVRPCLVRLREKHQREAKKNRSSGKDRFNSTPKPQCTTWAVPV